MYKSALCPGVQVCPTFLTFRSPPSSPLPPFHLGLPCASVPQEAHLRSAGDDGLPGATESGTESLMRIHGGLARPAWSC